MADSRAFPANAPPDQLFEFTPHGVRLHIPRAILTLELWNAFELGYYEGSEIGALRQAVRPGDRVLEIGGGVGFISTYLLKELGAASVRTVEADTRLIPIIAATHALNGVSAQVIHAVACRHDGTTTFHQQEAFWASSVVPLPGGSPVSLACVDLGRLVREEQPEVLVVDIEGGEAGIFEGLDLPGVRSLVVEVHQPQIGGQGIANCFVALAEAGFAYDPNGSGGSNVVFSRFESQARPWPARIRTLLTGLTRPGPRFWLGGKGKNQR